MNLIVPKHVAAAAARDRSKAVPLSLVEDPKQALIDEILAPIPDGAPPAIFWRVTVMQIGMRSSSKGGILLTEKTESDQSWAHGLGKIVSMGPLAFKAPQFEGIPEDQLPKVGDICLFNPKSPARVMRNGVLFMIMNDDAITSVVNPKFADGYQFIDGLTT
ncbi:MAG: hypothetical protein ABL908_09585 [Hyphomicrobium sp.]